MKDRESRGTGASEPADGPDARAAVGFRKLFEMHFAELYRFTYRYVQSAETAKDLVHEAFLRLWQQRAEVDLTGPTARSYLYTVARYRALDHLRRRRVEERWWRERTAAATAEPETAMAPDPDREFAAKETAAAIERAVQALPRRQREVLLLRWHHGATYDEIARTLGISPKTVAVHISRAIDRLRAVLSHVR
jgi:RNA polymerase sigma-70 factor (family 1)